MHTPWKRTQDMETYKHPVVTSKLSHAGGATTFRWLLPVDLKEKYSHRNTASTETNLLIT
jgi:hypothetical protein